MFTDFSITDAALATGAACMGAAAAGAAWSLARRQGMLAAKFGAAFACALLSASAIFIESRGSVGFGDVLSMARSSCPGMEWTKGDAAGMAEWIAKSGAGPERVLSSMPELCREWERGRDASVADPGKGDWDMGGPDGR